jgi:hypothetical protein
MARFCVLFYVSFVLGVCACGGRSGTTGTASDTGGSTEASGGESTDTGGVLPCDERLTQNECEDGTSPSEISQCEWHLAYPIATSAGGCSIGESVGYCLTVIDLMDGCPEQQVGCDGGLSAIIHREQGDNTELMAFPGIECKSVSGGFGVCPFNEDTPDADVDPAVCYCACDPGW